MAAAAFQRRPRLIGRSWLWLGCLLLHACSPADAPPPAASSLSTLLPLPQETETSFTGSQPHRYRLDLESGQLVRVTAHQLGADVVLSLHSAGGRKLADADDLDGGWGPEELLWLAPTAGSYELRLSPWQAQQPPTSGTDTQPSPAAGDATGVSPGRYRLSLDGPRAPEIADRLRLRATGELHRGGELERLLTTLPETRPALVAYARAAHLYGRLGDSLRQSVAHLRLGRLLARRGAMDTALRHYRHSLALLETTAGGEQQGTHPAPSTHNHSHSQRASLLTSMGRAYRLTGQPEQALASNLRALELYRQIDDPRGQALALNNLAVVYDNGGEVERALEHYEAALALWRRVADSAEEANTLHNLGTLYALAGRDGEAADFLHQALELRRHRGDRRGEAATLTAIGWGHHLRGEDQQAVRDLRQALGLRRAVGDRRGEATTLDRLGTVLAAQGETAQALQAYGAARDLLEEMGEPFGLANTLANLGNLHRQRGRADLAVESFRRALPLLQEVGDRHAEASARVGYARAQRDLGELDAARRSVEAALALLETHHQATRRPTLRSAFLDARYPAYELAVDLHLELHRRRPGEGWHLRALQTSERARGQNLLASLRAAAIENAQPPPDPSSKRLPDGSPELQRRRQELMAAIAALQRAAPLDEEPAERGQALRKLLRELDRLRGESQVPSPRPAALVEAPYLDRLPSLDSSLDSSLDWPLGSSLDWPLDWPTVQQSLLDEETLLLYFALGTERSALWWSTGEELHAVELPPRQNIEDAARRLHRLLAASHQRTARGQARIAARELSDLLLGPLPEDLRVRRLLLVPDGALHYVPFATLPWPKTPSEEPLITRFEVLRAPSLAVLAALRTQAQQRSSAPRPADGARAHELLAVVGDPVLGPGDPRWQGSPAPALRADEELPRLEHAAREAEEILRLVPAEQRLALLGLDATRQQVLDGRLASYRILHFATHALLDPQHPQLSALLLSPTSSDDGRLRAHELYGLSLPAELVVLSACRTALGQELRGEGLVGLTDGFLYAGATQVMVSLWPVSDRATAALMGHFYSGLLEQGLPAAEALRNAQLSLRQEAAWRAPVFWAGFVLVGANWTEESSGIPAAASSQKSQVHTHTSEDAMDLY